MTRKILFSVILFALVLSMIIPLQQSNALTTRTVFNNAHITASFGNSLVCGDHICALGEKPQWTQATWGSQLLGSGNLPPAYLGEDIMSQLASSIIPATIPGNFNFSQQILFNAAVASYTYGYPLVTMGVTQSVLTNIHSPSFKAAPVNQFANMDKFPDPDFKDVVRPNADTLYSNAWLDLSKEPIIMHVPDTLGRYYVMEILDAWTNVISSPGARTTGTGYSDFIIEGPNWNGTAPTGVTEIKSPTNMVWIIGRTQTNGESDYDAVHMIQQQYTLTPLSSYGNYYQPTHNPVDPTIDMTTPVVDQVNAMNSTTFFNYMSLLMKDNPPSANDKPVLQQLAKIGITPGQPFDTSNLDSGTLNLLDMAAKTALQKITDRTKNIGTVKNGWRVNLDLGVYDAQYLDRAAVAMFGLGANLPDDAIYPTTSVDSQGNQLNGQNNYVIHFDSDQIPPVNAFWSVTMYDNDGFFVKNPIGRYAIGSSSNMTYNQDGSVDIYIQHASPQGNEPNWLPSPQGDFNLVMRLYWPEQSVLSGQWDIPSVVLVK